ncbi:MAG: hypothetical protein LC647_17455, partial [Beggiatoa sp.]|nr:hypothetical protein [Beggiatoa sp.]
SAGAINAAYLASQVAEFRDKAETLARLWSGLTTDQIFRIDIASLARNVLSWGARLFLGQASRHIKAQSLVDTSPLCAMLDHLLQPVHRQLPGIAENLVHGGLKAVAVTASSYSTGQSVTWVQGDPPRPGARPTQVHALQAAHRPYPGLGRSAAPVSRQYASTAAGSATAASA